MNEGVKKSSRRLETLAENLRDSFAERGCDVITGLGEATLVVPPAELLGVAKELRDGEEFRFEELIDVCGMDYSAYGQSEWATDAASSSGFGRGAVRDPVDSDTDERRFAAVYHLLSVALNQRLRLRVYVETDCPMVDSVVEVWNSADWFEREAFDLFGILFNGHPDLRRILTDYGFVGHPFRKDFPLEGHVEMRYDAEQRRVIYEPVTIDSRTLVPKVIRSDNRYLSEESGQQDSSDA